MRFFVTALLMFVAIPALSADPRIQAFESLTGETMAWDESRLENLADALATLADDGLDPEAYGESSLRRVAQRLPDDPAELACIQSFATQAWLSALHDLSRGRLNDSSESIWRAHDTASGNMMVALAYTGLDSLAHTLDAARPQHAEYRALRKAHAQLMHHTEPEPPPVPAGPALRVGDDDPRVALLRERLAWLGYATLDAPADAFYRFDEALLATVKNFQQAHHLHADGIVGPRTLAMLNPDLSERIARVRANLERWRQVSRDLHPTQLRVDTGGARVTLVRNDETVWSSRVQIGQASRPTPLLQSTITRLTFNPAWVVPPTIMRKDKLPAIRKDIGVLQRQNLSVIDASTGEELDPWSVNWDAPRGILLRQAPGPQGALGQVAFRFDNPFLVFLHDTPSQRWFESDQRTTSSGCVRVERALDLAELLLGTSDANERIDGWLKTNKTREVRLDEPISILISHVGATVDADGHLTLRPDVYGHDAELAAALARDMRPAPLPVCMSATSTAQLDEARSTLH